MLTTMKKINLVILVLLSLFLALSCGSKKKVEVTVESGNYIELITENKSYVVRCKIGDFIKLTPDPLEYIRIHRTYIVRLDKVESKSKTELIIKGQKLPVSLGYESEIEKLIF